MLILLYYLTQNPSFADQIKPIMGQLNDSKKMFDFIKDLSKFQDLFNLFKSPEKEEEKKPAPCNPPEEKKEEEKKEQSPTKGIANEFIQQKLEEYFSHR